MDSSHTAATVENLDVVGFMNPANVPGGEPLTLTESNPGAYSTFLYVTDVNNPGVDWLSATGVRYSMSGTAQNGSDYTTINNLLDENYSPLCGTLDTYNTVIDNYSIFVCAPDNGIVGGTKTVTFTLRPGPGYVVDPSCSQLTVSIVDNDQTPSTPTWVPELGVSYAPTATAGDDVVVTLLSTVNQTVKYYTDDGYGTATDGVDFAGYLWCQRDGQPLGERAVLCPCADVCVWA